MAMHSPIVAFKPSTQISRRRIRLIPGRYSQASNPGRYSQASNQVDRVYRYLVILRSSRGAGNRHIQTMRLYNRAVTPEPLQLAHKAMPPRT